MEHRGKSIRPFIGAKSYTVSRQFYIDLGFEEIILFENMSYFKSNNLGFYLQDAYIKDWIDNTMVFLEVEDVATFYNEILALKLPSKYIGVKLIPIREQPWGSEFYLHDPSGVLWHFGAFNIEK